MRIFIDINTIVAKTHIEVKLNFFPITNTIFERGSVPLHGQVEILFLQSNELAPIYADPSKTIELENPIRTNLSGMLSDQVFLSEDENYRIVYHKLIDESEEIFEPVREEIFLSPLLILQKENNFEKTVETIAELQEIKNPHHGQTFKVLGYYSENDGLTPRFYKWFENATATPDFGTVLVSNHHATGRFVLLQNKNAPMQASTFGILPNRPFDLSANSQHFLNNSTAIKVFDIPGTYNLGISNADFSNTSHLVRIQGNITFTDDTNLTFNKLEVETRIHGVAKNMKVKTGTASLNWWKTYSENNISKSDVDFTGHTLYIDLDAPYTALHLTKTIENCDVIGILESQIVGKFVKCTITSRKFPFILADGSSNFNNCHIETRACHKTLTSQLYPWPSKNNTWVLNSLNDYIHEWDGTGPFDGLSNSVIYQSGPLPLLKASSNFNATPKTIANLSSAKNQISGSVDISLIPFYQTDGVLDANLFASNKGELALKVMKLREGSWKGMTSSDKNSPITVVLWENNVFPENLLVQDMDLVLETSSFPQQQITSQGKLTLKNANLRTFGNFTCYDVEMHDSLWEIDYSPGGIATVVARGNLIAIDSRITQRKSSGCQIIVNKITNLTDTQTNIPFNSKDSFIAKGSSFAQHVTLNRQSTSVSNAQSFFSACVFIRTLAIDNEINSTPFHLTVKNCRFNSTTDPEQINLIRAGHPDNVWVIEDNINVNGHGNLKQTRLHNVIMGGYTHHMLGATTHSWSETWGAGCETYDLHPNLFIVPNTSHTRIATTNGVWWNTGGSGTRPGWTVTRQDLQAYLIVKPNKMEINMMYDPYEEKYFKEDGIAKAWSKYAIYDTNTLYGTFFFPTIELKY